MGDFVDNRNVFVVDYDDENVDDVNVNVNVDDDHYYADRLMRLSVYYCYYYLRSDASLLFKLDILKMIISSLFLTTYWTIDGDAF